MSALFPNVPIAQGVPAVARSVLFPANSQTEQPLTGRSGTPWHTDHTATRAVPGERDVRASYVLPSAALGVSQSGVFWPAEGEYGYEVVDPQSRFGLQNRLVWVDLQDLG